MTTTTITPDRSMKYRYLGDSGLLVSTLSFGCMSFDGKKVDQDMAYALMVEAYKHGINYFDNAELYSFGLAETMMGDVIKRGISEGVWEREDLVISTKLFFGTNNGPNRQGLSRKHTIEGMKASLQRIDQDYVDVVFCHRPDAKTPIEETVRAMNYVIEQGWAFYWGTSDWTSHEISQACDIANRLGLIRPVVEQPMYHLLERSRVDYDYIDLYKKYKLGLTTYSPLCGGMLTGKYLNDIPEGTRLADPFYRDFFMAGFDAKVPKIIALAKIAEEIGASMAQFAIAWCASNQNVSTVMVGATNVAQLLETIKAHEFVAKITSEIKERVDAIVQFQPTMHAGLDPSVAMVIVSYD